MGLKEEKRGQVTIFIIIALLIIGIAIAIYFLIPRAETGTTFDVKNPNAFLQSCLEDNVNNIIDTLSLKGGSIDPENYFLYQGEKIEYLCYTNEYYKTCIIQQPLLKQHIEAEIKKNIVDDVQACFNSLENNYKNQGYNVNLQDGKTVVELLPKRVAINFEDYILTITKGGTEKYDSLNVVLNNNLYELTSIVNSIIDWESAYGDAETTTYMAYYKDLKVEKRVQQDGTKIYVLTDRNTGKQFRFASRSVAWPPGFSS